MVDILCIGVGEAFQPRHGSASFVVESTTKLLIDCGYGAVPGVFSRFQDPNELNLIYLTHFHADHFFGLPPVLHRWSQEKRRHPLTIVGQPGTSERVKQACELGYPGMLGKLSFKLDFHETVTPFLFQELTLNFALTQHPMRNYAIKVAGPHFSVGFSGDGALTDASKRLFTPCDILFLEAFRYDSEVMGHTSAVEAINFSKSVNGLSKLALVHIHRDDREAKRANYLALGKDLPFDVLIPEAGEIISFPENAS